MADVIEEKVILTGDASSLQDAFTNLVNEISKTREELKQYKGDKEKTAELTKKLADQENALVDVMKKNNNEIDASRVSYRQLNDILKDLNKTYKNTANEAQRLDLAPSINALNTELKGMDASIGNFQRNVGNYENAIESATKNITQSFLSVSRALPSLANGPEQFFMQIAQSIPRLVEAYKNLAKAKAESELTSTKDAVTHTAESIEVSASTVAHEGEAKAVAASASQHLQEAEALTLAAQAELAEANAAKAAAVAKRDNLLVQKAAADAAVQELQSKAMLSVADGEYHIRLMELNKAKAQSASLSLELAAAEDDVTAAEIREAAATNKLTIAQQNLNKAKEEANIAGSAKSLLKALVSWQTAILVVIIALTLYWKEISAFFERLFSGSKEMQRFTDASNKAGVSIKEFAKSTTDGIKAEQKLNAELLKTGTLYTDASKSSNLFYKEQKNLNAAMIEGAKSMAKQYVEIRLLTSIMQQASMAEDGLIKTDKDLNQVREDHNEAAEKMLKLLGETVNETNVAAMKTGEYAEKIDQLVASLYKQAQARGAVQLLEKAYTDTILKAQGELIDAELDRQANKFKGFWQGVQYYFMEGITLGNMWGNNGKKDFLDNRVERWENKLAEAKMTFEAYLAEITKMFDFDDLFGNAASGFTSSNSSADKWFSRWEMKIKELEASMGMLAEKNNEVNLADTWKYSAQGLDYYTKKFNEFAEHYRKENKGMKDEDIKELRELEVQRKQYLEKYYEYHNKLSEQYMSAIKSEKEYEAEQLLKWYEDQLFIYAQAGEDTTALDKEYELREEKLLEKYQTKYKYAIEERMIVNNNSIQTMSDYNDRMMNLELKKLEDTMNKEIKEYERKGISTMELEEHYAQERLAIVSKYAKLETEALINEAKAQEEIKKRKNDLQYRGTVLTGEGKETVGVEAGFNYAGGTTVSGFERRRAEMGALTGEKDIWTESMNKQIAAMQEVLASEKLVGEERLSMEQALADAQNELALGTLEYQMQIDELRVQNARETYDEIIGWAQQGIQGLGGMFDDVYTAIEKTMQLQVKDGKLTEEQAEKQLEEYRGIKAAAAMMDALGAAVGAYNSLASIPYVGPALGAVAAAAALAAGIANVNLIKATTKENAGAGTDSFANSAPSLSDYRPNYVSNITGKDDTDYLANAISEKPIKAYVVESEVTAAQEVANKNNEETTW